MTAFLITFLLISLVTTIFIYSAWIMVLFSTVKTILALYYSLIKRTIVLVKMRRKLNKSPAQNLRHYQAEGRGQTALATQFSALSFEESLELSRKDYKVISCIAFIVVVLFACATIFLSLLTKYTTVPHTGALALFFIVALPFLFILVCSAFTLPVILILHGLLHYGVKKTVKKLETFA
ncbi:hypothetical protein D1092_07250 [Bartonella krasnovii]|uniref:Uncharacterized protein n=1 Tax=Bartonella krasnovii TaxID=2267275 RepID=A0A5B9D3J8_9HYPH|nr:hypothetical protein D1092_07250 [Bartonella krasnovii]